MLYVKAQPILVKRITTCEQLTISHEQTYGLIRPNLLSLTVGFDRIDAAVIKTTNQTFKVNISIHVQQNHGRTPQALTHRRSAI